MSHTVFRASRLAVGAALLFILALPATAPAMDTFFVGPRAMGMAGANVASVSDTSAQYYNPAAFGFFGRGEAVVSEKNEEERKRLRADNNNLGRKDWGWDVFSVGAGLSIHEDLPELVDDLAEIDLGELSNGVEDASELGELVRLANKLTVLEQPGNGLRASLNGGSAFRWGSFGLGMRAYGQGGVRALDIDNKNFSVDNNSGSLGADIVDMDIGPEYDALAADGYEYSVFTSAQQQEELFDAYGSQEAVQKLDYIAKQEGVAKGDQGTVDLLVSAAADDEEHRLENNTTTVQATGFGLAEVPFTYGYAFNDNFSIGGNVKLMVGRVYATEIVVFDTESDEIISDMTEEYEESLNFGLDLGAMYRFRMLQFGLVGRNLNSPKFDGPTITRTDGTKKTFDDVTVKPQFQAGVAFIPLETLTFELDLDLTRNETQLKDYDTQYLRFGAEWDIANFLALRAGFYNNMAEDDIGLVYTAGVGLNLWAMRLDVGGAFSSETAKYDGSKYPKEAQVVAGLSIDF